jgi:glycosyltransferase involved in cell wall biosynthesis
MRVGIFLKLIKPEAGGGFTYQDEIIKALALSEHRNHEFVLLCQGTGVIPVQGSSSIEIVRLGSNLIRRLLTEFGVTHVGQDFQFIFNTKIKMISPRVLKKYRIDAVWFPSGSLFGQLDIPYVATVWDLQHRLQPWFPELSANGEWFLRERHNEVFLKQAAYIITGNSAGKDEIERFYGISPGRIRLLPHPTPQFTLDITSQLSSDISKRFTLPSQYFFYPAQFWPHKNHQLLLKAIHWLRESTGIHISLALTGSDKANKPYIKNMVQKYLLKDQIFFLDFVSREDLVYLYQNAFAVVVPSFFGPENFPPLEAFALGCPVLAARVAGAEEQYEGAALLFDPCDFKELANLIKSLLENSRLRVDLIQKGRARAKKWTSKDYVQSILTLFEEFDIIRDCWPRQ